MKICKDGRVWGQTNKEAGEHLGVLSGRRASCIKKGTASQSKTGNKNPNFGKHPSVEMRRKMSEARKGEKCYNWKGGVTLKDKGIRKQIEYRLWREAVFARDNWTCQECGRRGGTLHPHHIKSYTQYPELRFAIDNGQTLCLKCHKLTDNYGGNLKEKEAEITNANHT